MTGVTVSFLMSYASHLAFVALGVGVLVAAPRRTANRGFALYAIGTAARPLAILVASSFGLLLPAGVWQFYVTCAWVAAAAGLLLLVSSFPTPLAPSDRPRVVAAALVGGAVAVAWAAWWAAGLRGWGDPIVWPDLAVLIVREAVLAAGLALLALRAHHDAGSVAPHAIMTIGIALPWALDLGRRLSPWNREAYPGAHAVTLALGAVTLSLFAFLWLRNVNRGARSRWALAAAWCMPAGALAGMIGWSFYNRGDDAGFRASAAVARVAVTAAVAYAIASGQLPGLARKFRWGISRGTIAAAFVAVFFVASEGAQILFGQGNEWVGLLAAGALVFAIAPLQRAAERLAEKAVPLAAATPAGVQGEASYRNAVRIAMRDRTLTRAEETHLHELARDLGIDGARAHAIIAETEAEPAGGAEL